MSSDDIWKREEIDSPCVKLCAIHPIAEICVGCFRTADEIANWMDMGAEKRHSIMATLPEREKLLSVRRKRRVRPVTNR